MTDVSDDEEPNEDETALKEELAKDHPRKDVILPLLKRTFPRRRYKIVNNEILVPTLCDEYGAFKFSYAVRFLSTVTVFFN